MGEICGKKKKEKIVVKVFCRHVTPNQMKLPLVM